MRISDGSSDVCSSDLDARGKQSRNDGAADRAFGDDLIIVADAEAGVAGEIIRRAARRYVDRAAGRIAPIKRALRSTQHLDLLDTVEARKRGDRARYKHPVDMDGDAALGARLQTFQADSAQADLSHAKLLTPVEARHGRSDSLQTPDFAALKLG